MNTTGAHRTVWGVASAIGAEMTMTERSCEAVFVALTASGARVRPRRPLRLAGLALSTPSKSTSGRLLAGGASGARQGPCKRRNEARRAFLALALPRRSLCSASGAIRAVRGSSSLSGPTGRLD
jgi:hypothetical protein